MNSNPVIRSKQFGSFMGFLFLAAFVWLVNTSGGLRALLARAGIRAQRDPTPTGPQLVLLQGGKS